MPGTKRSIDKINGDFKEKDILSSDQFSLSDITLVLNKADEMKKTVLTRGGIDLLQHKVMAPLFFEPSSRTFGSFSAAMQRLGGTVLPIPNMQTTSVSKGETLADTVQVFSSYSDVLIMRHPEAGSVETAANIASIPVINAGDGINEHPTQALYDLYTIKEHLGKIDNLHVIFFGELARYRPVNSLAKMLAQFTGIKITFVSPPEVTLQLGVRTYLQKKNIPIREQSTIKDVIGDADVLYVTRVKKEFMSEELYKKIQGKYSVDNKLLTLMKKKSIIMHALPRIDEIATEVDNDPRAVYLRSQVRNGMYVRMALLALVLGKI